MREFSKQRKNDSCDIIHIFFTSFVSFKEDNKNFIFWKRFNFSTFYRNKLSKVFPSEKVFLALSFNNFTKCINVKVPRKGIKRRRNHYCPWVQKTALYNLGTFHAKLMRSLSEFLGNVNKCERRFLLTIISATNFRMRTNESVGRWYFHNLEVPQPNLKLLFSLETWPGAVTVKNYARRKFDSGKCFGEPKSGFCCQNTVEWSPMFSKYRMEEIMLFHWFESIFVPFTNYILR